MKIFESKPKEFYYLAILIIGFGLVYMLTVIDFSAPNSSVLVLWGSILIIAIGVFFISYGKKRRKIIVYDNKIEYYNPKLNFQADYKDIVLIKSFQEIKKTRENLIVMTEDKTLSVSSTFFDEQLLIECFRELLNKSKDYENITIEDDRLWKSV